MYIQLTLFNFDNVFKVKLSSLIESMTQMLT